MKPVKIRFLAALTLSLSIFIFSCSSPAENREDAAYDAEEANKELEEANQAYLEDIENYRSEVQLSIAYNDSLIVSHREIMKKRGLTKNPFYKTEIENLEAQNKTLKEKMDNYKGEGEDNWAIFKEEFTHDMSELGSALKDLTVNNTNDKK